MRHERQNGLVSVQRLMAHVREEVEALRSVCRQHEGLELPLHLEPARPVPGNETSQFLYYADGALVGFMGLQPEDGIEVLGMVHPEHRRRGTGRALLEAAKAECRRREVSTFLLVSEEASNSGSAFAEAAGASYRFSEYRMELDPAAVRTPASGPEEVMVARAGETELDTLAQLRAASFGSPLEASRERIDEWVHSPDQRFYIGRVQGKPVGSLRVFQIKAESTVYLNTFGVRPECRGRGYGRQILTKVTEELLSEGWRQIRIEVNVENPTALALYRSCGFREIAAYRYYELSA
jgi:ribosomal protein S18 acetylase RimI-like enzyme